MIRPITIFDGLFLLFVYFKLNGDWPEISWWLVICGPYCGQLLFLAIVVMAKTFSFEDRLKFFFWNWAVKRKLKKASSDARKNMQDIVDRRGEAHKALKEVVDRSNKKMSERLAKKPNENGPEKS